MRQKYLDRATELLQQAVVDRQVSAASLLVHCRGKKFAVSFGQSTSIQDIFLIASIAKPMCAAALMTLYERGEFGLDDPIRKYVPEFSEGPRNDITVRQLLSHVSGLPDQLPENETLRKNHADLREFVERTIRTPLLFDPGSCYSYSSMGILLACEIAQRITGVPFQNYMDAAVFQPLEMKRSALGLGAFELEDTMRCQTIPDDRAATDWDRNSPSRALGAPWGGVHASAEDVARFLREFLYGEGRLVKPDTAHLMLQNHNREGLRPRGLGFAIGTIAGSPGCSGRTFGHEGATGTLAWADPTTDTIFVVLTTLPIDDTDPHPRQLVSDLVAQAVE